jgi:hypothetical protein
MADPGTKYCVCQGIGNVDDEWQIKEGMSRAAGFPADAQFEMNKQYKKQMALSDNISNLEDMAVVSPRLKEFIEAQNPKRVEFLPVTIINHKDKPVPDPYHIVNPLAIVDCIDKQRSDISWNELDPEAIAGLLELHLLADKIDPELLLFRPKHLEHRIFVRRDFAQAIEAAGFTGVSFMEPDEFMD